MPAPTAIVVRVDRAEYSRHERGRDAVTVYIAPAGPGLSGQNLTVEIVKARRNRDVVVARKTLTLTNDGPVSTRILLKDVVETDATPLVRRGDYFVRVTAAFEPSVVGTSADFIVSLITADKMRKSYLHGTDQRGFDILQVYAQPTRIGADVIDVSGGHPKTWAPMSYTGPLGKVQLTCFADKPATSTTFSVFGGGLVPGAHVGQRVRWRSETSVVASNDATSITVSPALSSAPSPSDSIVLFQKQTPSLAWFGGPAVPLVDGQAEYVLRAGSRERGKASDHFVAVRLRDPVLANQPLDSADEELLIFGAPLPDEEIRDWIEKAASWVERTSVQVYLEPTRVVTRIPTGTAQTGTTLPLFALADWDEEVDAISHEQTSGGRFVSFDFSQVPIIRIDELRGELSNQTILTVPQNWIQLHREGGFVELVPYVQTQAWPAVVPYGNVLRGGFDLPNFWHFEAVVGFKQTPGELIDLVATKAAIDILSVAGQAYRGGYSSQSVSREGTSQSLSFTASAMYGIFSATINDLREKLKTLEPQLMQRYGGLHGGVLG